jgi:hypothetical protein
MNDRQGSGIKPLLHKAREVQGRWGGNFACHQPAGKKRLDPKTRSARKRAAVYSN